MLQFSSLSPFRFCILGLAAFWGLAHSCSSKAIAADFSISFDTPTGDARPWLIKRDFVFKIDANNRRKSRLTINKRGLTFETLTRAEPLIGLGNLMVQNPAKLTVKWGVNSYPRGANWDVGINNEAIMVMVQFGKKKFSGGFFMPPSPYFIGFFLCQNGRRNVLITGRSYKRQGRYICVGSPATGREITSKIDLDAQFRAAFGLASTPPVTGIAIESDTTQVRSDGRSSAWIKSIAVRSQ